MAKSHLIAWTDMADYGLTRPVVKTAFRGLPPGRLIEAPAAILTPTVRKTLTSKGFDLRTRILAAITPNHRGVSFEQ
jgi:hypothetical protein